MKSEIKPFTKAEAMELLDRPIWIYLPGNKARSTLRAVRMDHHVIVETKPGTYAPNYPYKRARGPGGHNRSMTQRHFKELCILGAFSKEEVDRFDAYIKSSNRAENRKDDFNDIRHLCQKHGVKVPKQVLDV